MFLISHHLSSLCVPPSNCKRYPLQINGTSLTHFSCTMPHLQPPQKSPRTWDIQSTIKYIADTSNLPLDHQIAPQHPLSHTTIRGNQFSFVKHTLPPMPMKHRKALFQINNDLFTLLCPCSIGIKDRFSADDAIYSTSEVDQQCPGGSARHRWRAVQQLIRITVVFVRFDSGRSVYCFRLQYTVNVRAIVTEWNSLRIQSHDFTSPHIISLPRNDILRAALVP